jgi:hypothetical protein
MLIQAKKLIDKALLMDKALSSQAEQVLRSRGRPKLQHCYGRIGVSAVVAALRFPTTRKSPQSIRRSPDTDDERFAQRYTGCNGGSQFC